MRGSTTAWPPEEQVETHIRYMWVWNWISVARLECALKYVPVWDLLASAKYISFIMIMAWVVEAVSIISPKTS